MQRWVQNHGEFVVHANEVLEGYEQLPVLVRPRYVLQLLGKHRPKDIVGEVEASHQPVQLTRLELAHLGHFAGVEEELHQFALRDGSWGWVRGREACSIDGEGKRVKLFPGEAELSGKSIPHRWRRQPHHTYYTSASNLLLRVQKAWEDGWD